jgi:hypothetical protein
MFYKYLTISNHSVPFISKFYFFNRHFTIWHLIILTLFRRYLDLNSVERSPFREANRFSASQQIPPFYRTRKFTTVFTRALCLSPVHAPHHNSLRSILTLFLHLSLDLPKYVLLLSSFNHYHHHSYQGNWPSQDSCSKRSCFNISQH